MSCTVWILVCTLLGLMTCPVTGQFPTEIEPGATPSDFPNERTLICQVRNGQPNGYDRIQNAVFYLNGNNVRDMLTGSEFDYSASNGRITIQLRQDLEGEYTCGNEDGSNTSPVSVTLVYFPSRDPDLDLYHVVAVGEEAVLPCGVNQGPLASRYTVQWYREDNFIRPIDTQSAGSRYRINSEVLQDFSLIIADTILSDSNQYHCDVEVEIIEGSPIGVDSGGTTVFVELLVSDRPMITYMTDDIIPFISRATNVELVCNATGSPNLVVIWFHNDKKIIANNNEYSVEGDTNTTAIHSRLTIRKAEITDSGSVTCTASISFQADSDRAEEEDTLTRSRTARLVILDDSLILAPLVTRDSDLLVDVSLRGVLLDQNMKILVRIISAVNQSQARVIPVQGEFSRSTTLYPFIRNSQLPKAEEGFQRIRIQVALIINGKTGPFSPNATHLQEQVIVDLGEDPTVGQLTSTETDNTMIIAISASAGAVVLFIAIAIVVAIVICCKFKTVRYTRRQESRERKMDIVNDQLTTLYDLLKTPTSPDHLAIIAKNIDRNHEYILGTKRVPGLIRVDGVTDPATNALTQEALMKRIEDLKKAAAKKKSESGRKDWFPRRRSTDENESDL